jgi:SulP family sulfate permease
MLQTSPETKFDATQIKNDVLSGLTVALALVPEAVAFAFIAGVDPVIGLYSAFFIGLITAVFGGRPGMISGATGAMAVVVIGLVAIHGIEYLFPTVILCGILQILVGTARLGKLIRMVPHPVMLGFVNGLAIVIFLAQFGSFKGFNASTGTLEFLRGTQMGIMLGLVALTMLIIWGLPKITKAFPSSLAAILIVTFLSIAINNSSAINSQPENDGVNVVATVGDMLFNNSKAKAVQNAAKVKAIQSVASEGKPAIAAHGHGEASSVDVLSADERDAAIASVDPESASIKAGLPQLFFRNESLPAMPPLNWATLVIIFPFALTLCGVGLIESLMTLTLIDEITETRGQGNRECLGQGLANIVCGLFGGMGGCAMIGQSLINVNSGGRGRLSGIVAAVCLLLFVLFMSSWIEVIPMAALVGVMFMVVIGTFEWASLKLFRKIPFSDILVMVLVAGYTVVMHDLATAVILGVIVSALVFAWQHATHIGSQVSHNEFGSKIHQVHGPLFFASAQSFKEIFDPKNDPDDVVIDFYYSRVYDQSGLEAINSIAERYDALGKRIHLTHLSPECRRLLDRADDLVEVNLSEDPQYHVATDRLG